jgi:flagellar biosynthesis protein FlhA
MSGQQEQQSMFGAEAMLAVAVMSVLGIMIIPLPPLLLDVLLAFNVGLSVLVLLISLNLRRAVEFSVFPSLLLITTLFRLALNVATTRLILLHGSEGAGAVGHVIETFGRFAVGGSLVVGAVIFLILLVVNFAVITKGSGRVSEVSARFTLDALPGKQMAIDADLAAGLIDEKVAKERRSGLEAETEFFGAMDGASKFVRGDAVAGLAITAINIVGGLLLGLIRDGMSLSAAVETYTLLTVGDGLVSQMPALLVSTAAGIVVTRAAGSDLGSQVKGQLFGNTRVLQYTSAVMAVMGLIPGLPALPFFGLAAVSYALGRRAAGPGAAATAAQKKAAEEPKKERIQDLLQLDAVELEVGMALLPLIDLQRGAELPGRVTTLRKQLASELGVVLPSVHLKDDLRLDPNDYRIKLRGIEVGRGQIYADRLMALDPSGTAPTFEGLPGKDPAFGLAAVWIATAQRGQAESMGLTVVDPSAVITTHLSELLRRNAHELLGRQEVQELLAACAKEAPKLVEDTVPGQVTLGELVRVLRGLLREGISVRDLRTILEAVADAVPRSKDTNFLVEQARRRLARQITSRVADPSGVVRALTLDRPTEDALRSTLGNSEGEAALAPDLERARALMRSLETRVSTLTAGGHPAVVLAPPDLRKPLFDFACRFLPELQVITARELVPGTTVEPAGLIQLQAAAA